jgi:hypothetical protein
MPDAIAWLNVMTMGAAESTPAAPPAGVTDTSAVVGALGPVAAGEQAALQTSAELTTASVAIRNDIAIPLRDVPRSVNGGEPSAAVVAD